MRGVSDAGDRYPPEKAEGLSGRHTHTRWSGQKAPRMTAATAGKAATEARRPPRVGPREKEPQLPRLDIGNHRWYRETDPQHMNRSGKIERLAELLTWTHMEQGETLRV